MYQDEFDPDNQPDLTDVFRLVTIDRQRNKKISVTLVDGEGDEVPVKEVCIKLLDYINDQMSLSDNLDEASDKTNKIINQIMPLVSQSMVSGLPYLVGDQSAYITLSMDTTRHSMLMMMILGVCLYKFIKDKGLKIVTEEEEVSQEELDKLTRISKIASSTTTGTLMGKSPTEIITDMYESGEITEEDLEEIIGASGDKWLDPKDDDNDKDI